MKEHVFRLIKGDLLKESIFNYCTKNNIKAGVIVSSVGCLSKAYIRNAGASKIFELIEDLEIVSLNGTVSKNRIHLHIGVANEKLQVFGGHLENGCVVNSTCEIVILELTTFEFDKYFDDKTRYNELLIKKK